MKPCDVLYWTICATSLWAVGGVFQVAYANEPGEWAVATSQVNQHEPGSPAGYAAAPSRTTNARTGVGGALPEYLNIAFQGRFVDDSGFPLIGPRDLTFQIVDSAGALLWTGATVNVELNENGVATTQIPSVPLDIFGGFSPASAPYQLKVSVAPDGLEFFVDILATPLAFRAFFADNAEDADLLNGEDAAFYRSASNINDGVLDQTYIDLLITRDIEVMQIVFDNDGSGSTLDADLLDGADASDFAGAAHAHAGEDITSGTVAEAYIDDSMTRDSEVMSIVEPNDYGRYDVATTLYEGTTSLSDKYLGIAAIAGGDLSGNYPDPKVSKLHGWIVSSEAPDTDQVLKWNGNEWAPGQDDDTDTLDGLSSSSFLRSDATDSFTSGTLSFVGSTELDIGSSATLDVNGSLRMDGPVFKTGTTVVTNFNADLLDTLSSSSFLRSDAGDEFNGGVLAIDGASGSILRGEVGSRIEALGELEMWTVYKTGTELVDNFNADLLHGEDGSFYQDATNIDSGVLADDRLSSNVALLDNVQTFTGNNTFSATTTFGNAAILRVDSGQLQMNSDGPDQDQAIFFYDSGIVAGEHLLWDNNDDRFQFSDDLSVDGVIRTGDATVGIPTLSYNHIGPGGTPVSGGMDSAADLFVEDDLEIGGNFTAEGPISTNDGFMAVNADGPDGTSSLFFYESGIFGKSLRWDDFLDTFKFNDSLALQGGLRVGTITSAVSHSWFGSGGAPLSGEISTTGDVFVENDLETGGGLYINGTFVMDAGGPDGDQTIYFYDNGDRDTNYISWDDVVTDISCPVIGTVSSAFVFNINDNSDSGWVFTNGGVNGDVEFVVDELGNLTVDGVVTNNGACDLAEAFLGPESLGPGTVVSADLTQSESVRVATEAYDSTIIGVVSTRPGVLLNGPIGDFYPVWDELQTVREVLAAHAADKALQERKDELEQLVDTWRRGNVHVAVVGRVPCNVDGSYGAIRRGDRLTSSATPGHARAMNRPGPSIGIALEDWTQPGTGSIIVLLQPGWTGLDVPVPRHDTTAINRPDHISTTPEARRIANLERENAEIKARLADIEQLVASLVAREGGDK